MVDEDIEKSAEALKELFEGIDIEGEDYERNVSRTPERSEDRWGLKSDIDTYRSIRSIDIIIDEFGNKKINIK